MSELELIIRKSQLANEAIAVPASKSYTHRALIAAALSNGKTSVKNPLISDDTLATVEALKQLGAKIIIGQDAIEIDGSTLTRSPLKVCRMPEIQELGTQPSFEPPTIPIDCKESGTTLRLLMGVCSVLKNNVLLTGSSGLLKRPTRDGVDALKKSGVSISDEKGFGPVLINAAEKNLKGGKIRIRGDSSSQFISGLLFALPLAENDSILEITTPVESQPYIEMTIDVLQKFGITIGRSADYRKYTIKGNQKYISPQEYFVEGDYSSAAFMIAAGLLAGPKIVLSGLKKDSLQADAFILDIIKQMNGKYAWEKDVLAITKSNLKAITIDVESCPDLVPILATLATQAKGKTRIINAGRLRIKESDRLSTIASELSKMGARIKEGKDFLEITGPTKLTGAVIDPHNDHRIAMACTIAGLIAEGETTITHPEVVKKSYPDFFYHMRKLNATVLSQTAQIGKKFKVQLYGGSHEKVIGVRISGLPPMELDLTLIKNELAKRRPFGKLTTPRREEDEFTIVQGVKNGKTTGGTIVIEVPNKDTNSKPYELTRFTPRPNHGDYTTFVKYGGVFDFRGGGFLSARMTVGTIIAGALAKQILTQKGIEIGAFVKQVGTVRLKKEATFKEIKEKTYANEVRCPDEETSQKMKEAIEQVQKEGDSLGGIVECQVHGLPVGVGEPIFHSIDSIISQYLFSVPAVKGIEFGSGFAGAATKGSENNDAFTVEKEQITTKTNNSGGIQGGISNGMPLIISVAIKPTSSIAKEQDTVDMQTNTRTKISVLGRHDPCVAIRAPVIVEAHVACALLDLLMRE